MKPPASRGLLGSPSQIASAEAVNYFPAHMLQKLNWTASKSLFPQHDSSPLEARRYGNGGLSSASQTQVLKQLVQNSIDLCKKARAPYKTPSTLWNREEKKANRLKLLNAQAATVWPLNSRGARGSLVPWIKKKSHKMVSQTRLSHKAGEEIQL